MSAAADGPAGPRPDPATDGGTRTNQAPLPAPNVVAATRDLLAALRRVARAWGALFLAEAQVLRASIGLVFLAGVALVAFTVSLWACLVALIGWALWVATGSAGIALGLLVLLHVILMVAIWFAIKRAVRRASFPAARAELRALGKELHAHLDRFRGATSLPDREPRA